MTTTSSGAPSIRALLLDVEGTTTPVAFVYDVLFPYARRHLDEYLTARIEPAVSTRLSAMLAGEWAADHANGEIATRPIAGDATSQAAYLTWLMDRDRKSPALKLAQGEIWEVGYRDGELRGQVYDDVPRALTRWTSRGITIAIYSSGSVAAQRLLFENSELGDLTPAIAQYFDTGVGAKRSVDSYARISEALGVMPAEILFISDVDGELEAAQSAGYRVVMCARPGNASMFSSIAPTIQSFDEVDRLIER